ncbi:MULTISPECIES: bifunctional metallophosphatase/5'-nucleotidase [Vagococcus]|uniref:2',3'-cyclic-nucleotide 2'-phosphodiesterase n=1 Tax=Vagococcus fluvialis bH819 TaxID=1255619 RepID=A0A1X6WNQ0_9ENTE|nr:MULTISPECIES: bifunctional metallophosphatase/5'-nucleotidase [Vagococcus]SLM85852.1 2',3'-cyclic-nucleotide 2'-phosphodiesterase [Vagococcus fluvialis bH819]HCM90274.1 bifunctional metallophosphatase/5'-nucleotidase [Vagococcus sp.]
MKLTILSTSDTHGYLYPTDFRKREQSLAFGLTKVKEKMLTIENSVEGSLLKIDNGDFLQGSPLSYFLAKNPEKGSMADVMNEMGYDCGVLGNHEFNYGLEFLENTINKLNYPIICANILKDNGEFLTNCPYIITEREGVKIAILGLTTQYIPNWEQPKTVEGLIFKSALETAKEFVPKLREEADVIVVSYHGGFERDLETGEPTEVLTGENEGYALLHEVEGIDVLLTGHQHRVITLNEGTCPVTQPGDKGRYLARVDLNYDATSRQVTHSKASLIEMEQVTENKELHTHFLPLLDQVENWLDEPQGSVSGNMIITDPMDVRIHSHPYIEFIQDVQKEVTGVDISGTALFDNNGTGFGESISMRDIVTNYIYPNTVAVLNISGADLKEALERCASYFDLDQENQLCVSKEFLEPKVEHYNYDLYSGIDYCFDITKEKGSRVTQLCYNGQEVKNDDRLEVVMNQYRAVGGGDYFMFGPDKIVREITIDMTELISDYLQKYPQIKATQPTNIKLKK